MVKKCALMTVFLSLAIPAFADIPTCTSGNLAGIIGTTCDIGPLQFTFDSWQPVDYVWNGSGYDYYANVPPANDFTFTVLSNGFTLSGDSLTIVGPGLGQGFSSEYALLDYELVDLSGDIASANVSAVHLSATGNGQSFAGVEELIESGNNYVGPYAETYQDDGLITHFSGGFDLIGSPFSSGYGEAEPFSLTADSTADIASWGGSSTFTFNDPVPEPSSFLLFGTLVCLCFVSMRKSKSPGWPGQTAYHSSRV